MSADDAIFIQRNSEGKIVAQHGFMSYPPPDPDKATDDQIFFTLDEAIMATQEIGAHLEYGYQINLTRTLIEAKPQQFRAKAGAVRAIFWEGPNVLEVMKFAGEDSEADSHQNFIAYSESRGKLFVAALSIWVPINNGEWVVRGPQGLYNLSFEVFKAKYPKKIGKDKYGAEEALVDAIQFDGTNSHSIAEWLKRNGIAAQSVDSYITVFYDGAQERAIRGDWLIVNSNGGFNLYSDDDFYNLYEVNN